MSGIVEELFIANDSNGLSQVWFRNWSVTASLNLRGDWAGKNPESVKWGVNKDAFVVRVGFTPDAFEYHIYRIPRDLATVFGAGVIPVPTHVRTESPAASGLGVITLTANYTDTRLGKYLALREDLTWVNPGCLIGSVTPSATRFDASFVTAGTKGPTTFSLGSLLNNAANATIDYGLNKNNELVLFIATDLPYVAWGFNQITNATQTNTDFTAIANCTYGSSNSSTPNITVPITTRGEFHLFVINTTTGSVLFRTAQASPTLSITKHTAQAGSPGPLISFQERQVVPDGGTGCGNIDQCVGLSDGVAGGTTLLSDLGLHDSGTQSLTDHVMDTTVQYVSGSVDYTLVATDTPSGATNIRWHTFAGGAQLTFQVKYKDETWADQPGSFGYQYDVLRAYPITLTLPVQFLVVVRRQQRTSTGALSSPARGLFLMRTDGATFRTIEGFNTDDTIVILTANRRHAIWYRSDGTVHMTAFNLDVNGRTRTISTNVAGMQLERFRLMDPEAVLWDGKETVNAIPAGVFLDAWQADGTPTLLDAGAGFPLLAPMTGLGTLAVVPAGVPLPVLPTE